MDSIGYHPFITRVILLYLVCCACHTLGLRHIAFIVENVEDIVDTLKQKGRELVGEFQTYEALYRVCYIRGPEGMILQLAE
jgi:hypothetical protein